MKYFLFLFSFFALVSSQYAIAINGKITERYKQYLIVHDDTSNASGHGGQWYLVDSVKNKYTLIGQSHQVRGVHFEHNMIFYRFGDQQGLLSLDGRTLIGDGHQISWGENYIYATNCGGSLLLTAKGDTLLIQPDFYPYQSKTNVALRKVSGFYNRKPACVYYCCASNCFIMIRFEEGMDYDPVRKAAKVKYKGQWG